MNIFRISLVGLGVAALVLGCGSSDGGHPNTSKLAACNKELSPSAACIFKCVQDKCGGLQKKCYGDDYNGGVCQSYAQCTLGAPNPCMPAGACGQPLGDCSTCIGEIGSCYMQNCAGMCSQSNNGAGGSGPGPTEMGGNGPAPGGRNGGGFGNNPGPGGFGNNPGPGGFGNSTGGFGAGTGATGSTGGGACGQLNACCGRIMESNLKSACTNGYSAAQGDESLCAMIYDALTDFC